MKKIMKRIVASICALTLVAGSLAALSSAFNVKAATEGDNEIKYLSGYRNVTTSSFYNNDQQMPDSVTVDGGVGAAVADTVAVYATIKDMQGTIIENHHKTLLSLKVGFENDSSSYSTRLEVAGKSDNTGFRLHPEMNQLRLEAIGGVQAETSVFRIATDTVDDWAEEFNLQMSFEYGDFDNNAADTEANDVKIGVYINGTLGTVNHLVGNAMAVDNHAVFYDCDMTKLGTYMKAYTENTEYGCDLSVSALVPENPNLAEVTWSDFKLDGTDTWATDKVFTPDNTPSDHSASTYVLNHTEVEKFGNTSFEAKFKFGSDGGSDMIYLGGAGTWSGMRIYPTGSGALALVVNNTNIAPDLGFTDGVQYFYPSVAKLVDKTFLNHEFTMKVTTEYGDFNGDGDSNDVQLGFYFDGKLYNNQYCYVSNYLNSGLTGNYLTVEAGRASVSIQSVEGSNATDISAVDVSVNGVYKDSSAGQVKLVLAAGGTQTLPSTATYANIVVTVSDGTTATDYTVDGALTDGILTLNLADKIIANSTNTITVKAGTYQGVSGEQTVSLRLVADFVCYQDKGTGVVYQLIGNTKLEAGQNFNANANLGQLYLVGTDFTSSLQGFVSGYAPTGEWWTLSLIPLNEESGVFRKSGNEEPVKMNASECSIYYPTEGNTQYFINVGDNKTDGDIFTIKGQFKVVNSESNYKDYQSVIEFEEVKYQYMNASWSSYTEPQGPWTSEAEISGVYKESSNGMVKVVLSAVSDTTLPTTGACTDVSVAISNGVTTKNDTVTGTITEGKLLTINLADKIIPGATNTITIKAGTYNGTTTERQLSLKLTEDFVCYQDKSSGVIYQEIGSTKLEAGQNFNANANLGQLYLVGTDFTSVLQGFVSGYAPDGEWWTISLVPLNEASGVFRKSGDGESVKMNTSDYSLSYPTEGNIQYFINVGDNKADGDVFTIKGQFKVVNDGTYYKDYQNVICLEAVRYEYNNGLWREAPEPNEVEQPDPSFKKITFSHFNLKDKVYTNSGKNEFQAERTAKISLNKTLLCGEIQLENGREYDIRIGGENSVWHGLYININSVGNWFVYWVDNDGTLNGPLASMTQNVAGTPLVDTMLPFMLSTEIVAADDDGIENDIKYGFWFDNILYNNEYLIIRDKAEQLGSRLGIMGMGEGTSFEVRSIPELVEAVDPEDIVVLKDDFKKITFAHFGIEDGTYNYKEKNFSVFGKAKFALDKTVFSGDIFIPEGTDYSFQYGGNEHAWYGLMFDIEPRGVIHISWHDMPDYNKYLVTDISSSKAQTPLFGEWVNLKISTEIIDADKDGQKDDIRFGIWFNDIPYNEEYLIVYDKASNLGSHFGVVASAADSYIKLRSIEELVEPFNYEAYGLTKDWEKTLLNTGLTSEIPIGGSRESGPYSGDASNIAIPLIVLAISVGGLALCLLSKKRNRQ